jgi:endonuclease YncB( thermonuclease family)
MRRSFANRASRQTASRGCAGAPYLGVAMVRDGHAVDLGGEAGNPYHAAVAEAQTAKRGIWRGTFDRPSDWRQANPRSDGSE